MGINIYEICKLSKDYDDDHKQIVYNDLMEIKDGMEKII
jgi:hypothetical protein